MSEAWVTLATTDAYALGAIILGYSLREVQTTRKLHCMITKTVSDSLKEKLRSIYDKVTEVDVFDSKDEKNLALIGRADLGVTFTKINCWRLTEYTKCVFIDADCLVIANSDDLFDHEELSAVADVGWPDCFNSGVFVFKPSENSYADILNFAIEFGSFDGGDQGLLNMFFKNWRDKDASFRLSFIYNMTSSVTYSYAAAYKYFGSQVKIVHFLGEVKPWHFSSKQQKSEHFSYWWSLYSKLFNKRFEEAIKSGDCCSSDQPLSNDDRIRAWEIGCPDFKGVDSFENIQKAINDSLR